MTTRESILDATIVDTLQRERDDDPTLGMSQPTARLMVEQLQEYDRGDDDALRAYDLISQRARFGRAW